MQSARVFTVITPRESGRSLSGSTFPLTPLEAGINGGEKSQQRLVNGGFPYAKAGSGTEGGGKVLLV